MDHRTDLPKFRITVQNLRLKEQFELFSVVVELIADLTNQAADAHGLIERRVLVGPNVTISGFYD